MNEDVGRFEDGSAGIHVVCLESRANYLSRHDG